MKLLRYIKLISTDLDETLLGPDHKVSRHAAALIKQLQARGVVVAVVTGRAPEATRPIVRDLGLRYYICTNGAAVFDGDRLLAEKTMSAAVTDELARFFADRGLNFYLMTAAGYFASGENELMRRANAVRGVDPQVIGPERWGQPAHKVMALGAGGLYPEVKARFGDRVHVIYHPEYLEIAPAGVNKAWGLQQLAAHLNIAADWVLAMGDALNDLEALRWAGIGVAMGDGLPELRQAADFVTAPHTEDGCARVLERVLEAHREGQHVA